ncbi:MAG: cell division protein ZapA [Thermovirgaceae bacterium]
MAEETRRVSVLVGKKTYPVLTRLDEERFESVIGIVRENLGKIDSSVDQEERLLLTCFKLAHALDNATRKLSKALKECGSDGSGGGR